MTGKLLREVRRKWLTILATLMILIGVGMLVAPPAYFWYLRQQGVRDNSAYAAMAQGNIIRMPFTLGTPERLVLPRLKIDLSIVAGKYTQSTQDWLLDRTHAFYILPGTSPLESTASPLIYGHDIPEVFHKLDGMAVGEVLYTENKAGQTLMFRYVSDTIVKPEQGVQLNDDNDGKTLNLLTCTGPHFSERRIMHFRFVGRIKDVNRLEL